jgi:hypothetical protein
MRGLWVAFREFARSIYQYARDLDNWIRRGGLKPKWGRKPTHFTTLEECLQDYLSSLPSDEARREFIAQAAKPRAKKPPAEA